MKYVKEHINEKFYEDSDPIHDMGIGRIDPKKLISILKKKIDIFSWSVEYSDFYMKDDYLEVRIFDEDDNELYRVEVWLCPSQTAVKDFFADEEISVNKLQPKIGWYLLSSNPTIYVEPYHIDEVIKHVIKANFSKGEVNKDLKSAEKNLAAKKQLHKILYES